MKLRFLAPAQAELLDAIAHYTAIEPALGLRFQQAVDDAVRRALAHPERGAPRSKCTRRWLVSGFPFSIIYRATDLEVLVVAVAHQRRRPEFWIRRI